MFNKLLLVYLYVYSLFKVIFYSDLLIYYKIKLNIY